MIIYYKNNIIQTKEQAESKLDEMDNFVTGGTGKAKPLLDELLTKIWNQGEERLNWQWSEETQQEIDQREQREQSELDQIERYQSNIELWKNEKIRPIRDNLMIVWFDSLRSKPELWEEQDEEIKAEALTMRQTLKDWPATFSEYVSDEEIEAAKPLKPSYITV